MVSMAAVAVAVVVLVGVWWWWWSEVNKSLIGRVKLSMELVEERGETGRWERRWRGSKWPWKNMSSAGDKSRAIEDGFFVLPSAAAAVAGK